MIELPHGKVIPSHNVAESKRRTVLQKLKRIIVSLWLIDRSRSARPEVMDEVKAGL